MCCNLYRLLTKNISISLIISWTNYNHSTHGSGRPCSFPPSWWHSPAPLSSYPPPSTGWTTVPPHSLHKGTIKWAPAPYLTTLGVSMHPHTQRWAEDHLLSSCCYWHTEYSTKVVRLGNLKLHQQAGFISFLMTLIKVLPSLTRVTSTPSLRPPGDLFCQKNRKSSEMA